MVRVAWFTFGISAALLTAIAYEYLSITRASQSDDDFEYITSPLTSQSDMTEASRKLIEYTRKEFLTPEVLKVTDRVHVAIGFALSNSIMIEGDDGIIIVDTTETVDGMRKIMTEFRKISRKPVKAIIITHFHVDHIVGVDTIIRMEKVANPDQNIDVYAHETTTEHMTGQSELYDIIYKRAARQFGTLLPRDMESHTGDGIGIMLRVKQNVRIKIPNVTVSFQDHAKYTVAGVTFELLYTPGETDDQITVWLPHEGVVMPADNIYKTFPNLYAIRGAPTRDCRQWYQSLDKTRELGAKYMVPLHTRPVVGAEAVYDTLLIYRDAIKYVHDQTVRLLNKGFPIDTVAEEVRLPDNLASHPYLQEHYGTVEWSVRGVFDQYLGWFSGDPADLEPMHSRVHATKLVELVSQAKRKEIPGVEIILQHAQKSRAEIISLKENIF